MRKQIERLRTMLEDSQKAIWLSKDHFRSAISCALQILGADPLEDLPRTVPAAASSSSRPWTSVMAPTPPGLKPWTASGHPVHATRSCGSGAETSPIRPVVFEDPGVVTDEVVQLHLEHRAVQRLLSRFTAQGFVHHDLSRACLAHTADAVPRVLLIGRLALYGPGAARLHEELVPMTARWIDPAVRKSELTPYSREAETRTMALLDAALLEKHERPVPEVVIGQLQSRPPRDVHELLPHLERRAAEYARDATQAWPRGRRLNPRQCGRFWKAAASTSRDTVTKHDRSPQLMLDFPEEEKRQLESNRRYWGQRLVDLDRNSTRA